MPTYNPGTYNPLSRILAMASGPSPFVRSQMSFMNNPEARQQLHGDFWNSPPENVGYDPRKDLQGGFWNSPSMVTTPHPLMVSQKPNPFPQVQVNNQGQDFAPGFVPQAANDGGIAGLLKALTGPRGHHFGIGGAEISDTNPYGNPGGDPFKNGFFKQQPTTPGMMFLKGNSFQGPDRINEMALARIAPYLNPNRGTVAPIPMPQGDPQARAFWSQMGY